MKRHIFSSIVIILICINALALTAFSETGVQACNGRAFSTFTTVYNGKLYVSKPEYTGNFLKSRTSLYAIDTQELKAQRIFSTRNSNSSVIVYQNDIYFMYPNSFFGGMILSYDYSWYKVSMDKPIDRKVNWIELTTNEEMHTDFIPSTDGLYKVERSKNNNDQGFSQIYLYHLNNNIERCVLSSKNSYVGWRFTCLEIAPADKVQRECVLLYDYKAQRYTEIPLNTDTSISSSIIIIGDSVYYTTRNEVMKYDVASGEISTLAYFDRYAFSRDICYSEPYLYWFGIDDQNIITVYEHNCSTQETTIKIELPSNYPDIIGEYFVYDNNLFIGDIYNSSIRVYDLSTGEKTTISLAD